MLLLCRSSNATNLLFAAEQPNKLNGLNYEIIAVLREVIPYLQRGDK